METSSSHMTPINDGYETCEFTYAELRIYGDTLDPEHISSQLGIVPSNAQVKGQELTNSLGRKRVIKLGGWFLSSEHNVNSKDIRTHLNWLLYMLMPAKDNLLKIQSLPGTTMLVACIWWSAFGQGGPTLWPEQMKLLADLNLECSFEISFYGPEQ